MFSFLCFEFIAEEFPHRIYHSFSRQYLVLLRLFLSFLAGNLSAVIEQEKLETRNNIRSKSGTLASWEQQGVA